MEMKLLRRSWLLVAILTCGFFFVSHTETGLEPGLSHYYYEIIRSDTTSDTTREYYRQLCIEYHSHFDPDFVN